MTRAETPEHERARFAARVFAMYGALALAAIFGSSWFVDYRSHQRTESLRIERTVALDRERRREDRDDCRDRVRNRDAIRRIIITSSNGSGFAFPNDARVPQPFIDYLNDVIADGGSTQLRDTLLEAAGPRLRCTRDGRSVPIVEQGEGEGP